MHITNNIRCKFKNEQLLYIRPIDKHQYWVLQNQEQPGSSNYERTIKKQDKRNYNQSLQNKQFKWIYFVV